MSYILGNKYRKKNDTLSNLIYISYRYGFTPIPNSIYVSDIGWGCTLRNGQMLLANVFLKHLLPKWSYKKSYPKNYYNIISHFRDSPSNIFSIHKFIEKYPKFDKKAGDWIGPYTLAMLISEFKDTILNLYNITYICESSGIIDMSKYNNDNTNYLISIPVRLGLDYIDKSYYSNIIHLTKLNGFMGLIGGQLNKSYYFIGSHCNKLIYLDPHKSISYHLVDKDISIFQPSEIKYLNIDELSPTFTIFFYLTSDIHVKEFENINNTLPNPKYPLFDFGVSPEINNLTYDEDSQLDDWNVVS